MSSEIINHVDANTAYQRAEVAYPYILVESATEALAVLMGSLETGDLSVCLNYKGQTHILDKQIARTPTNLNKLIKVYPITFVMSETERHSITHIKQLLDLDIW